MKNNKVRYGEIYVHDFGENKGSVQNGIRPVLVIQGDELNQSSPTTVVAAITSELKKPEMSTHILLGKRFGLKKPSMVMMEQLKTVNQTELKKYIGRVNDWSILRRVEIGSTKFSGTYVRIPSKPKWIVKCLCKQCMEVYKRDPRYLVKRQNIYAKEGASCVQCGNKGWRYIITDRRCGK